MNENQDNEEDIDLEEDTETSEKVIEQQKKQEEITLKRTEITHFKTQNLESLAIMENEPLYRTPLTNIIENEEMYYMLIELPGLNKKNVRISLQEGNLELIGETTIKDKEKKEEKKEKDKDKKDKDKKDKDKKKEKYKEIKGDYLRREIRSTSFFRSYRLPEDIVTEEIDASFKNGILRLKIPKKTARISDKHVIEIK